MPVSGVIIAFTSDDRSARHAHAALAREPRVELGPATGTRRPATIATDDPDEDRLLWQWLNALPGVAHVDVVFVHFDPPGPPAVTPAADAVRTTQQEYATP